MRTIVVVLVLGGLCACADVQSASLTPNDPGYWYNGAPQRAPQIRAPGNERTYRPLGGAIY